MTGTQLGIRELTLINQVAARRFAGAEPRTSGASDETALPEEEGAFVRATGLACFALDGAFAVAARPTALLAVYTQLRLDGYDLLAPQGAAAGMINRLAAGDVTREAFAHWLEDRSVKIGAGL